VKEFDDNLHQTPGRNMNSKNEYFVGVKSKAGYGIIAQGVEYGYNYVDASRNTVGPGDASLSLLHPIYENDRLKLWGMFREYFPIGNYSVTMHQWQQAYYFNTTYKMANRWDLFNQVIPRNFVQDRYNEIPGKSPDTTFYVEDFGHISRKANNWFRYGVDQHLQIEAHNSAPVGKTWEIFPLADFMLSPTIYMGPRVYFPIAVQNSVYDAPTAVSTANIQAEVYLQATM
jgi:hypothetical protein